MSFYISDEHERSKKRSEESRQTNCGYVSPTELHSLKSLDFCDTPELDLYSSIPRTPRTAHKRKNKSKKLRQCKSSGKELINYNHNGLMTNIFDSESEGIETYRCNNPYGLSKNLTKTRNSERNMKQLNNHGSFLDGAEGGSGPNSLPPVVVTSQKYKCLDSMPVCKTVHEPESSLKTCPPRFTNTSSPFFGTDRVSFYKNFSLLIDLGKSRDKDMKRHTCSRQMSSEEELWRSQFGDVIWLELQAHLNQTSPSQQDANFMKCREHIPKLIEGILSFRISSEISEISPFSALDRSTSVICSCDHFTDDLIPSAKDLFGTCLGSVVNMFCRAAKETTTVMHQLDHIESLYPTQKALFKGCPAYGDENLQRRISALHLWFNVSRDLFQQLKSILDLMSFSKYKECSPWSCIDPSRIAYVLQSFSKSIGSTKRTNVSNSGSHFDKSRSIFSQVASENIEDTKMEIEGEREEANEKDADFTYEDEAECDDEDDDEGDVEDEEEADAIDDDDDEEETECDADEYEGATNNDNSRNNVRDSGGPSYLSRQGRFLGLVGSSNGTEGLKENRMLSKSSVTSADSFEALPSSITSIYRHYVDRDLKRTGMRKFCNRLKQMMDKSLSKSRRALEFILEDENYGSEGRTIYECMAEMNLPSFSCVYHFLCHVPLDVIHECLKLRLERQPKREPSLYILKTLIYECKEVISSVIDWKKYYLELISFIECTEVHETEMGKLEEDLMKMLQVYFNHMQQFMKELQQLPKMSKELKNFLEKEWNFMKMCFSNRSGDDYVGNKFCNMASSLIQSISDFLDGKIEECISHLCATSSFESQNCVESSRGRSSEFRQSMLQLGRDLKLHFNEARERSNRAVAFAKMLKKDLEVAALYNAKVPSKVILEALRSTNHTQIILSDAKSHLMFASKNIPSKKNYASHLLNISYVQEKLAQDSNDDHPCYLVLARWQEQESSSWRGEKIFIDGTTDIIKSLVHLESDGWLLLTLHSFQLAACKTFFEESLGDHLVLANEQMSCRQDISKSINELKNCALDLRVRIVEGLSRIIDRFKEAEQLELEESEKNNVLKSNKEAVNYCFTFAFEYHKEILRLVSWDMKGDLPRAMIGFARVWMKFAQSCDRGRGVKPRWASHGFEFLKIACEPKNLNYLNDEEFNTLTNDINCCISHIIGTKPTGCSPDVSHNKSLLGFSLSSRRSFASPSRSASCNSSNSSGIISSASSYSALKTSLADLSTDEPQEGATSRRRGWRQRQRGVTALNELDCRRNEALIRDKVIGRVSDARPEAFGAARMRRVKFKWQRGIKIGEGQFGKVYIAINLDNDFLMAMKEIKLQSNDHQAIKKIDEEIKTFEGIKHKSLVQYFGVELYRDEMIIFMEYCQNGTIEDLAKQGLDEHMVRRYSNEILQAIYVLHCHDIVHRDIKGANIFLMPNNSIKLGDFGCSVKLKSHTTMAGELNEYVGTPAFMAPEVIKGDALKGYGRAADIWSFGCVVIQMTTGKRPWPELESKIQIFFKVGSGAIPQIPEILSEEGKEFVGHCLDPDDEKRWTAENLMDHPFVKIIEDDDLEIT